MSLKKTFAAPRLRRLGYALFSLFILWHVAAITIVGPFSKSYLRDGLMQVFGGYLSFFKLDRSWPFYAPNPAYGRIMRYETIDGDGKRALYPLTQARDKFDHAYFRYTNFYFYLFNNPQYSKARGYDVSVARYLCGQHANDKTVAINFIVLNQKRLTYLDYQQGKRPQDPDFLTQKEFGPYPCQTSKPGNEHAAME